MNSNSKRFTRKIFIIAHECNDLKKPLLAMEQGANAIECDVWADESGKWFISHDGSERQNLDQWLTATSEVAEKFVEQLSFIIFDIKKSIPLHDLIDKINKKLPPELSRIYSVAKIRDASVFADIIPLLNNADKLSIDGENDPDEVKNFFKSLNFSRCCYGNGVDSKFLNLEKHHSTLKEAARLRDSGNFNLVYIWTVERKRTIRKSLTEDGVDAVMVNLNGKLIKPINRALKIIKKYNLELGSAPDLSAKI
jgi:glycerophosphoryl diester phosphodiesterase